MSDYKFFMANIVVIIALAFGFAFYGLADMLDEDVDIGENGEDFDTNRLIVEPDTEFIDQSKDDMKVWDGDEDEDERGSLLYGSTEEENFTEIAVEVDSSRFALTSDIELWVTYYDGEEDHHERHAKIPDGEHVFNIDEYPYGITQMVIYLEDEDAEQGLVALETVESDLIEARDDYDIGLRYATVPRDDDTRFTFFTTATDTITTTFNSISQVPEILYAWVQFIWAIPGLIGTAFRMYITGFFAYLVIDKIWLG